jgi:nitroreductase
MNDNETMLLNEIKNRYSVRIYQEKEIEEEKINTLIEAARLAPSARNYQNWKFVIIKNKERRKELSKICKGQNFVAQAPLSIVLVATNMEYTMSGGTTGAIVDVAIAGEHIALQAVKLGLGTCWIGAFYHDQLATFLNLPKGYRVICILTVGYPAHPPKKRKLKPVEEVVVYEKF